MSSQNTIQKHFSASAKSILANQHLADVIINASDAITQCFDNGGKLLICGNGGSAADAQHLSSELLNRYHRERQELPGIAITTDASTITSIGNDYSYDEVFAKQVRALGNKDDILMVITTSGNSNNILKAVDAAHQQSMTCIALNGKTGGPLLNILNDNDINILVEGSVTARVQEVHGLIIHCICELIDDAILGPA